MPAHTATDMNVESSNPTANSSLITKWWTLRLAGPIIAAAVIRLTLLAITLARNGSSALFQVDPGTYLEPGRNLILHGCFAVDGVPDLFRTPGYPLLLAITSLAGFPAAAVVNVILSVFTVFLVWRLGWTVSGDNRIALGAAWIFAFEPMSVVYSVCLTSETLFIALFLLSIERLTTFLRKRSLPVLAVAGLWLAAATFVRPITYYLPVALAVGLSLVLARVPGLRWKAPAVLLISVLPWLAAWQIRNWVETGYSGFSSVTEVNLYFLNAAEVTARVEHRSFSEVSRSLGYLGGLNYGEQAYLYQPYLALHPEQTGWSQGSRLLFMRSEAYHVIRAHYGVYLQQCVIMPLLKTIINPGAGNFNHVLYPEDPGPNAGLVNENPMRLAIRLIREYPRAAAQRLVFEVVLLGLYLFATRGIILVARGVYRDRIHNKCFWLLLGTSFYFVVVTGIGGGPGADARYRLPIMPAVCILASAGAKRAKLTTSPETT
jgi:hypothetical protein